MDLDHLVESLRECVPPVMRWAGAIASRLRHYNIALAGKHSGSASTDALTLTDLTVQELLVAALRDGDPALRLCRIEAEETTGDLARFAAHGRYTICLDPIDGTRQYRDRTGNGYGIILTLRSQETVHYTLVLAPESGAAGTWVEASHEGIACGPDDLAYPARVRLQSLPKARALPDLQPRSRKIYLIGFQQHDKAKARLVTEAGLEGVPSEQCEGCLYELLARGDYAGSLIHTPNVYDFPASLQIARALGGDSLWVHSRQPVHFGELWMDDRAHMLRLPGIVATSPHRDVLDTLCNLAKDWNPVRYAG